MSFAYLPLYTGDYLRDTRHLSMAEHGAYILALVYCWDSRGPMPLDERRQFSICRAASGDEMEAWRRIRDEYFVLMDDGWYNRRMMLEIERSASISAARSGAAAARWSARTAVKKIDDASRHANAMQMQCKSNASGPSPSPSPSLSLNHKVKDAADAADVWAYGMDLLTKECGLSDRQARSYLGQLCKFWSEATVFDALMAATGKADPKAYARKWLDDKPRKGQKRKSAAEELIDEIGRE